MELKNHIIREQTLSVCINFRTAALQLIVDMSPYECTTGIYEQVFSDVSFFYPFMHSRCTRTAVRSDFRCSRNEDQTAQSSINTFLRQRFTFVRFEELVRSYECELDWNEEILVVRDW